MLLPLAACGSVDALSTDGCSVELSMVPDATSRHTVASGGVQRSFLLHLPKGYRVGQRYPVALAFHGRGESDQLMESYSDLDSLPVVVAYPQGVVGAGNQAAWEGAPYAADIDDVRFVVDLLELLGAAVCIDPNRIYATGKSNGGGFAALLACRLSTRIAAIAPVSGAFYIRPEPCRPRRPVPVLDFHGTSDPVIPYDGNGAKNLPSIPAWLDAWAQRDGCTTGPDVFLQTTRVAGEQ